MGKVDFKKTLASLYSAPRGEFVSVAVPDMQFVKIDGQGDPNTDPSYMLAIEWLYSASYAMKFAVRAKSGRDYVVPPLEDYGGPTILRTSWRAASIAGVGQ